MAKRPPNEWMRHYAEWRKNNKAFMDSHPFTEWAKEAKKSYKPSGKSNSSARRPASKKRRGSKSKSKRRDHRHKSKKRRPSKKRSRSGRRRSKRRVGGDYKKYK